MNNTAQLEQEKSIADSTFENSDYTPSRSQLFASLVVATPYLLCSALLLVLIFRIVL